MTSCLHLQLRRLRHTKLHCHRQQNDLHLTPLHPVLLTDSPGCTYSHSNHRIYTAHRPTFRPLPPILALGRNRYARSLYCTHHKNTSYGSACCSHTSHIQAERESTQLPSNEMHHNTDSARILKHCCKQDNSWTLPASIAGMNCKAHEHSPRYIFLLRRSCPNTWGRYHLPHCLKREATSSFWALFEEVHQRASPQRPFLLVFSCGYPVALCEKGDCC